MAEDENKLSKSEKKKAQKETERRDDWRWVMSTTQGRRVIREILGYSGQDRNAFVGQSNQTIYNTGMQKVGQYVRDNIVEHAPGDFLKLIEENING